MKRIALMLAGLAVGPRTVADVRHRLAATRELVEIEHGRAAAGEPHRSEPRFLAQYTVYGGA
jgi:hypothetical protein